MKDYECHLDYTYFFRCKNYINSKVLNAVLIHKTHIDPLDPSENALHQLE